MMKTIRKDITTIKLTDRIRKKPGDIRDLAQSLEEQGQIAPIVLNNGELIAGFRRMTATGLLLSENKAIGGKLPDFVEFEISPDDVVAGDKTIRVVTEGDESRYYRSIPNPRKLKPGEILAIEYETLTDREKLEIEIQENVMRQQFNKAEEAIGFARLKSLMEKVEGREVTTKEVAKAAKVSRGQVTMGLIVAKAVEEDGRTDLLQASSVASAYTRLNSSKKIEELKARVTNSTIKSDRNKEPQTNKRQDTYNEQLACADARQWIKTIPDNSIDFINFDPPWGIGVDSYDRNYNYGTFDDEPDTLKSVFAPLVPELYRVLKIDTYMVVWFGIQHYQTIYKTLETLGGLINPKEDPKYEKRFKVDLVPSLWYKTDKSGSQNDPTRTLLNVWEPFFVVRKGDPRMMKHAQKNLLSYRMPINRIHFAEKNVDLLVDILERYSFGSATILDPTFGSGSVFLAAKRLGRNFLGCEKDKEMRDKAIARLRALQK